MWIFFFFLYRHDRETKLYQNIRPPPVPEDRNRSINSCSTGTRAPGSPFFVVFSPLPFRKNSTHSFSHFSSTFNLRTFQLIIYAGRYAFTARTKSRGSAWTDLNFENTISDSYSECLMFRPGRFSIVRLYRLNIDRIHLGLHKNYTRFRCLYSCIKLHGGFFERRKSTQPDTYTIRIQNQICFLDSNPSI